MNFLDMGPKVAEIEASVSEIKQGVKDTLSTARDLQLDVQMLQRQNEQILVALAALKGK